MDLVYRYSSALEVTSTNLEEAAVAFEYRWVSKFCYQNCISADKEFQVGEFKDYNEKLGIYINPVPPRRNSRNTIESKSNIFQSIFLRLKEDEGDEFDPIIETYKAVYTFSDF